MNVGVCAAYKVGRELTDFIVHYRHPLRFVATHADDLTFSAYIERECLNSGLTYYHNVDVNSPEFIDTIKKNDIDIMLLLWWPTIIKPETIRAAKIGWINLHPSYLPYGRGKHPYYWAINEGTPFGVTIHFIDESVDGGKILVQRQIPYDITATGETLYAKSLNEIVSMFKEAYPYILTGGWLGYKPWFDGGDIHYAKDLEPHSTIHLDDTYTARDLLNRIRGRTFLNGDSAHLYENGKKYRVKVIIEECDV